MATILSEQSRTFNEFLLLPNLTRRDCIPSNVILTTPLAKFRVGEQTRFSLNSPIVSSAMQAVSGEKLSVALAKEGGISFVFCSQSIEKQVEMIRNIKKYKSGFVVSDANVSVNDTLEKVLSVIKETGHSTIVVTEDGTLDGNFRGLVTSKDYRLSRDSHDKLVRDFMTPIEKLVTANDGVTLSEANDIIWDNKINCLPVLDGKRIKYLIFRKDYDDHKENPLSIFDKQKRFAVGAAVNTRDYKERIPALHDAGADVFCIDSSDGFSEWQADVISFVRSMYGDEVIIGAGNVVDKAAFDFLASAGADFVKVGIGGGSICITREQKGIGRGQASALIDVVKARDEYLEKTGIYIPICSDGGIVHDNHLIIALSLGADFVMMGRYFARFDESPSRKVVLNNTYVKEYWAEGSNRAKNWQRYDMGDNNSLSFEEGVDSYVPYAGKLADNVKSTLYKIKSTMCNCGALSLQELHDVARLVMVSSTSILEGKPHDIMLRNTDIDN
ncbi:IMP dehydrogenase [Oscillospiraceae bacterium 42-9]